MSDAKQNYENTTKFIKVTIDELRQFLEMLADAIEGSRAGAAQKEMAKWIKESGQCTAYTVEGKCGRELKAELSKQGIGFIEVMDESTLVVKTPDIDRIREINRDILKEKGNYYQEIDGNEMERIFAKSDKIPDKTMMTLHGLDKYEYETLKNKCNDITKGFMVGLTKENSDEYALSIHAAKTYNPDPNKMDFCKAYASMALSLYGANSDVKRQQIDADEKLDKTIASLKGCENTHYVIGVDDPRKFIEINAQGFELHRIRMVGGKIENMQVMEVRNDSPDYEIELQKCLDGIYNKAIIDNDDKLFEHISVKQRNFNPLRPEKSETQAHIADMEKKVVQISNEMIKSGPKAKLISKMPPKEAFEAYREEMFAILTSVMDGKEIPGYDVKNTDRLLSCFKEAGVEPNEYMLAAGALRKFEAEQHKASLTPELSKSKEETR
ncbi:MAG: hypothetical protein K6G10_06810 [Butyrivibrio sp.]|nr:hypothetical protein [Butyrivibrio sp.]